MNTILETLNIKGFDVNILADPATRTTRSPGAARRW